jgi:SAM-dependent methyltransferase
MMQLAGKMFWALRHPRSAVKNMVGRVRYPAYKYGVGPPEMYETLGLYQFELLKACGLRPNHSLLDIGCGSLRAGKFFVRYLDRANYVGIEPNRKILEEGIKHNLDQRTTEEKSPTFSHDEQFTLTVFNRRFDFLLAHSILTHAPQHQIERCLAEAQQVVTATSLFFANYNKGGSDYSGANWISPGGHHDGHFHGAVTYTFACISSLARKVGFQCAELNVVHPTGSSWIVLGETGYLRSLEGQIGAHRFSLAPG